MKLRLLMATWLSLASGVFAGSKPQLEVGQAAPDFSATSTGGPVKLADYGGKWLVLYFYPKSFTSGCTKEACSLRDGIADLGQLDAIVLGVSGDDLETQKKFKAEYKLPFELIADTDRKVAQDFDIPGIAGIYQRRTLIIDPDGKIAHIFSAVNVNGHAEEVSACLKKLQHKD